jgi:hypothetical protein
MENNNKTEQENVKENCLTNEEISEQRKRYLEREQKIKDEGEMYIIDKIVKDGLFTKKEQRESEVSIINQFQSQFGDEEMTEEEKEKIIERLKTQKKQFDMCLARDRRLKIAKVRSVHPHVTNEEALVCFEEEIDPEQAVLKFTDADFLWNIRYKIAIDNGKIEETNEKNIKQKKEKKKEIIEEEENEDSDDEEYRGTGSATNKKKNKQSDKGDKKDNGDGYVRTKLKLDDALKNTNDQKGWSPARIKAFKSIKKNPNAYYYRFNEQGKTIS